MMSTNLIPTGNSSNDLALAGEPGQEGTIQIRPGNRMPLIPHHMFKVYADYQWFQDFLNYMLKHEWYTWFAKLVAVGEVFEGPVTRIMDFGAFVDIGVKQDGLLHRTQLPFGTGLKVGDIIDVSILKIEKDRGRIGLGWVKQ